MMEECEADGSILPSIESFSKRWQLPKVHYVFYNYIVRPIVGDKKWKKLIAEEDARLATAAAEAFALATLRNSYPAWLLSYKLEHPNSTLKTEYDCALQSHHESEEQGEDNSTNSQEPESNENQERLFSGSLDLIEISVPTPMTTETSRGGSGRRTGDNRSDFDIVLDEEDAANAKAHDDRITNEVRRSIRQDDQDSGAVDDSRTPVSAHKRMLEQLRTMREEVPTVGSNRERKKRKYKAMRGLRDFTNMKRKRKKGSSKIQGWTSEGKRHYAKTIREIKADEQSGTRAKWDYVYKKLIKVANDGGDEDGEGDDEEEPFHVDDETMYAEV